MKTAVSLPDSLFAEAERVADRLGLGNVLLSRSEAGLKHDCVANVSQLITVDRAFFADPGHALGKLSKATIQRIDNGLSLVLSL